MAGARIWLHVVEQTDSGPEEPDRILGGRSISKLEETIKRLCGKITSLDHGSIDEIPFTEITIVLPEWKTDERFYMSMLLGNLLPKALDEGTGIAFEFNRLPDEA
jgi:hypothetical protein